MSAAAQILSGGQSADIADDATPSLPIQPAPLSLRDARAVWRGLMNRTYRLTAALSLQAGIDRTAAPLKSAPAPLSALRPRVQRGPRISLSESPVIRPWGWGISWPRDRELGCGLGMAWSQSLDCLSLVEVVSDQR